jgi:hypothetical protein
LLTSTAVATTRQSPATLVLLVHGITRGESTARLACERPLSRQQMHTLRQRVQAKLNDTAPSDLMAGTIVEADALYQNAGEKQYAPSRRGRSAASARHQRAWPRHQCQ